MYQFYHIRLQKKTRRSESRLENPSQIAGSAAARQRKNGSISCRRFL
jgi:hypothetical protein